MVTRKLCIFRVVSQFTQTHNGDTLYFGLAHIHTLLTSMFRFCLQSTSVVCRQVYLGWLTVRIYSMQSRTIKIISEQTDYRHKYIQDWLWADMAYGHKLSQDLLTAHALRQCGYLQYTDKYIRVAPQLGDTSKGNNGFMHCYGLICSSFVWMHY